MSGNPLMPKKNYSTRGELANRARVLHMRDAIQQIEKYIEGIDYDAFMEDSMLRFACLKQLEIVEEAAKHLTE